MGWDGMMGREWDGRGDGLGWDGMGTMEWDGNELGRKKLREFIGGVFEVEGV